MRKWLLACPVLMLLGAGALLDRELELPYRGYSNSALVEIEPGTRAGEIAGRLAGRGVLAHRTPFLVLYGLGRARHRSLKAGEYLFDRPLAPVDVYRKLIRGDIYLHSIVVPEGSDRFDMAEIFHGEIGADPGVFLRVTSQASAVHDLDPQAGSLEGYLFPDTYRFPRGASPAAIAQTMLARFRHVLGASLPAGLRQSPARLHQTLILASLVEKETPAPAERPLIAGVFERRIADGMPLQCDPTVVYAARLAGQSASGPITQSQLDLASPYNTYRTAGLPPGPICSPGEASIEAALHPAPGDALYFVSNNHGGHVFASTLAEHQRNVARYRRELAELRQAAGDQGAVSSAPSSGPAEADGGTADGAGPPADAPAKRKVHDPRARQQHPRSKKPKQKGSYPGVPGGASTRPRRTAGDPGR